MVGFQESMKVGGDCAWRDLFDKNAQDTLNFGYIVTGLLSVVLCLWLNFTFYSTGLTNNRSYSSVALFTMALLIRRFLPMFNSLIHLTDFECIFKDSKCNLHGFIETFLSSFEVETLTHICIERYVIAKYTVNGWKIQNWHYELFRYLSIIFSLLYASVPVMGYGSYKPDFSCMSCVFDMILPEGTFKRYMIVFVLVLRSVKPFLVMVGMLYCATQLEKKLRLEDNWEQISLTRSVMILVIVTLSCWASIVCIRGVVVFGNLFGIEVLLKPYVKLIQWALWLEWCTPAVVTVSLYTTNTSIRRRMAMKQSAENRLPPTRRTQRTPTGSKVRAD